MQGLIYIHEEGGSLITKLRTPTTAGEVLDIVGHGGRLCDGDGVQLLGSDSLEAGKYTFQSKEGPPADHAVEMQIWNGYYTQLSCRYDMTVELVIAADNRIYGAGSDDLGEFSWTGRRQGTQVHIIKQYHGKHKVNYDGEINGNTIAGTWTIHQKPISSSDTFFLTSNAARK